MAVAAQGSATCEGLGVSGTHGGACGGASDGCGGPGASGTHDSACGGANGDGSVQVPDDDHGGASEVLAPTARKGRSVGGWPATVPIAVHAGAPTVAAAARVPVALTTGLAGALVPTAMEGGPTGGWERAVAPAAATAPTTLSWEVAVAA
jgi:hypothetical protein